MAITVVKNQLLAVARPTPFSGRISGI